MTVALSLAGVSQALNITCAAPATLGTVSIRVAGSPNVKNFTEIVTKPGTKTFDILGTATNGVDKNGTERAIEPESLKVVSGTGTVNADGTISVAAPAPGQTSEVVYELCAGEVVVTPAQDGVDEVQVITFDRASASSQDFKRTAAFTLGFGEESSDPIWSVRNTLTGNMVTGPAPRNWQNRANDYILFHEFRFPSADAVKAALEGIPGIGAGNVEVVELPREINRINRYKVTFVGALKQKDVPELEVTNHYSLPPQELLADLLELAGELTGGEEPGGSTTTTTIPGGLSLTEYYEELNKDAQRALNRGDFAGYLELTGQALQLIADNPTAFIDIQAAIAAIGELFPPGPVLSTETPGEPETAAEVQQLCSQGVISLSTTATSAEDAAAAAAAPPAGAAGAPAANAATGAPIKITG
jgi:hypothetical protein